MNFKNLSPETQTAFRAFAAKSRSMEAATSVSELRAVRASPELAEKIAARVDVKLPAMPKAAKPAKATTKAKGKLK